MRRLNLEYLLPLTALVLLGVLAGGVFYKQNFNRGVSFPYLGDAKDSVDCNSIERENLLVVLAVGQSIASNYGEVRHTPGPNVYSFYNGRCFVGSDPLPGADGSGGSIWSRLGDHLVQKGYAKNVLLVAIGSGGSSVAEWVPDAKLYPRLADAAQRMRETGFSPNLVIWHQGTRDKEMDPELYRKHLREIVYALPFLSIPLGQSNRMFVATHTRCYGTGPFPALAAAQQSVVDHSKFIYAGPDMDVLGSEMKYDGCHYNGAGLTVAAAKWLQAIEKAEAESAWLPRVAAADMSKLDTNPSKQP